MAGIGVVVLVGGIVGGTTYIIKQQMEINKLEKEIINVKQNMNSAFELLNNVSKSSTFADYGTELRFSIISYSDHQLQISIDFIDLIKPKHALLYSELPNAFCGNFNAIHNGTEFAMIQVIRCSSNKIKVEVSVMKEKQTDQLVCHHYHAGIFGRDRFETRLLNNALCYKDGNCYELDEQLCIGYSVSSLRQETSKR
uniref:Uncharacterized protein n=1 Tax=Panagrolaimus davidi TaxID=227884 RepID=A0A914QXB6_9BILA